MATAPEPMIGTTVSIVASTPAAESQSGYEALSFTEIGKVLSVPETGNQSEAGSVAVLKTGQTQHYNATKTVPAFTVPYIRDAADAGQGIVRTNANNSTEVTLRVSTASGVDHYIQGVLGNLNRTEAAPNAYEGESIEFRSITQWTTVEAA